MVLHTVQVFGAVQVALLHLCSATEPFVSPQEQVAGTVQVAIEKLWVCTGSVLGGVVGVVTGTTGVSVTWVVVDSGSVSTGVMPVVATFSTVVAVFWVTSVGTASVASGIESLGIATIPMKASKTISAVFIGVLRYFLTAFCHLVTGSRRIAAIRKRKIKTIIKI